MAGKKQNEDEIREFAMKLYESVCANIRISDDISFKLLSFVPLTSGAGVAILSLAKVWTSVNSLAVILLSFVAALITFGLYKWEMRNVQKCDWLIRRAAALERYLYGKDAKVYQFNGLSKVPKPPLCGSLLKKGIGKTEAEKIVYWAAILAWVVPIIIAVVS